MALHSAQLNLPSNSVEYYSSVEEILSVYLGAASKNTIAPTDHGIFSDYAAYWESHFNEDLRLLGCLPPTITTRISEFIPESVSFVEKIIQNEFAYPIPGGTVYFDINAFEEAGHFYAKLEPGSRTMKPEDHSLRIDEESLTPEEGEMIFQRKMKRHPRDFALWKKSHTGEPGWQSPWGFGSFQA